ncbi:MAG: class I SAM-dependent methyltransferase [Holosporales bacterium]|jgi:2-polyprenyl-6-hydroxyphenyl methylase/3-demethylubiquinone-9 3-methyltransferase|nr:class I SAM-dependent methyltransferase [Holosporales bacterium]
MQSLRVFLKEDSIEGKRFLDIGSDSGLFSLATYRLGAEVVSFDYDEDSVQCTQKLKDMMGDTSRLWSVFQGSILDQEMLRGLGTFDIVYSWGVLHHTGNMQQAFENVAPLVAPHGKLFISIYNDQGFPSKGWLYIKKMYNSYPILRLIIVAFCAPWQWKYRIAYGTIRY